MKIGGPFTTSCPRCRQRVGEACATQDRGGANTNLPCPPHAARVKAAPRETVARPGDVIEVAAFGSLCLAVVTDDPVHNVRLWLGGAFVPYSAARCNLLRHAPDGPEVDALRAVLAKETGVMAKQDGDEYKRGWRDAVRAVAKRLRAEHGEEAARIAESVRPPRRSPVSEHSEAERKAWVCLVATERAWIGGSGTLDEYSAAKQALRDLGVDVDALLAEST